MELLRKLIDALGPSGMEGNVRKIIEKEVKKYVHDVHTDKFGNLIAHKKGKGARVMLAAHMDEIGLMVKSIGIDGKIRFSVIGGLEPITLVGQFVYIMNGQSKTLCNGVITSAELHEDRIIEEVPNIEELYVDTGFSREQLQRLGVEVGNYVIAHRRFRTLGSKKVIAGKALDDRIGCYILIKLAEVLSKIKTELDIYYVFTVQEEVGLYGAKISVFDINPEWGVAVDTTNAVDAHIDPSTCIGEGPCLTIKDQDMIANRCLNDYIENLAEKKNIPLQPKVEDVGTTDATNIMLSRRGVPSTVIAIPVRNIHSVISIAHMDDINNAIKLMIEIIKHPPKKCVG